MRTSISQFELMVTFMEQHGDLSKPSSNARGRMTALMHWDELVGMLNSDGSGDTKPTEKWKKVWSDYKNNIKKKAARIHRGATGTGGGPATFSRLTPLEERVMKLVGKESATGLMDVQEAGVTQVVHVEVHETPQPTPPTPVPVTRQFVQGASTEQWNEPGPSWAGSPLHQTPCTVSPTPGHMFPTQYHEMSPPLHVAEEIIVESAPTPTRPTSVVAPAGTVTPPPPPPPQFAAAAPVSPRRRVRRIRNPRSPRSPRRRVRPAADQAANHFLQADEEWRNFRMQQHRDFMEAKAEELRLRELEINELSRRKEMDVQIHREWTEVAVSVLQVLDKFVSKIK